MDLDRALRRHNAPHVRKWGDPSTPSDDALHLEDDGVLERLCDYEALHTWKVLRSARFVVTVAEIRRAAGTDQRVMRSSALVAPLSFVGFDRPPDLGRL